jgi:hypothetical protein
MHRPFAHNDVCALHAALRALRRSSVCYRRERVRHGCTVVPLCAILDTMREVFPAGKAHLVVDEAHATGLYKPEGHETVALLGLDSDCGEPHARPVAGLPQGDCGVRLAPPNGNRWTDPHSRVVDEHNDLGLSSQLRAVINTAPPSIPRRVSIPAHVTLPAPLQQQWQEPSIACPRQRQS